MADDGGGSEMVACAIDVTHQVFIYVGLPRHYFMFTFVVCLVPCAVSGFCFCV